MSSLADLQRDFQRAVATNMPDAEIFVTGMGDPMRRLSIYRNAYRNRLTEALRANYPVLAQVLGDEAFAGLALQYIDARPSRHASIRWFGDDLADFTGEPDASLAHPALQDLIRLEWAIGSAFDAPDAPVLTREALRQLPVDAWPALQLGFHPSVRLIELAWTVEPIWRSVSRDIDEAVERDTPEPRHHTHSTAVWREGLTPKWRSLDAAEAACLGSAMRGARFARSCELAAATAAEGMAVETVASWLHTWLSDGMLSSVSSLRR